jgi:RNA polymerase sigma-70 factor (ECF subfamily)
VAALESVGSFGGKSTLRTWLTSILRFKVIDLQRRASDRRPLRGRLSRRARTRGGSTSSSTRPATGARPAAWSDPEAALEQRRFWEAFERCLDRLPRGAGASSSSARSWARRPKAICKDERITPSNCWVILHRARLACAHALKKAGSRGSPDAGVR